MRVAKRVINEELNEKNANIVIPPKSLFTSKVYAVFNPLASSISLYYPKGYYKLRLYYVGSDEYIAETIVWIE
jgi:hypothetical protein